MTTMTTRKDELIKKKYFLWLCNMINAKTGDRREMAWFLHQNTFYGTVPNDDNRAIDGQTLREQFADEVLDKDCPCLDGPCTMLEMLVALAVRFEFILSRPKVKSHVGKWFWEMVENLQLKSFEDHDHNYYRNMEILNNFLMRNYSPAGEGGLFPLRNPRKDQRQVEIWYQLQFYLDENYPNY